MPVWVPHIYPITMNGTGNVISTVTNIGLRFGSYGEIVGVVARLDAAVADLTHARVYIGDGTLVAGSIDDTKLYYDSGVRAMTASATAASIADSFGGGGGGAPALYRAIDGLGLAVLPSGSAGGAWRVHLRFDIKVYR